MRNLVRLIDTISHWTGKSVRWLSVALVLVMSYDVIMRYAFNSPTMWAYETSIMIGAAMYALAWCYVHRERAHIRVDVLYMRLSPRGKAIVDVVCTLLFFLPLIGALTFMSGSWMWRAWIIGEKSVETYWYPPIAPLRTVVFLGIVLFALQGVMQLIRDLHFLMRNKPYD